MDHANLAIETVAASPPNSLSSAVSQTRIRGTTPTRTSEAAYDRFLCAGTIEPLTLFGFFPSLMIGEIWLILSRTKHVPQGNAGTLLLLLPALCVATASLYGVVGLTRGRRYLRPVLLGKYGWRTTTAVALAAFVLNNAFYVATHPALTPKMDVRFDLGVAVWLTSLCILTPISEELAMQGYVQTRLHRFGVIPAVIVTSVLFVIIHATTIESAPSFTSVAHLFYVFFPAFLVYAIVRELTGSLLAVMLLHALENATIVLYLSR